MQQCKHSKANIARQETTDKQQNTHGADWCVAESCLEASHTAGDDTAQAIHVKGAAPHGLDLVLEHGSHLVTAQVGHGCSTQQQANSAAGMSVALQNTAGQGFAA
jgi:hypothetical protein